MQELKSGLLERLFKLSAKKTTVKTEILAGFTTFITVAYILFVNPNILGAAGIPKEAAIASTIWIAALGSLAMGLYANYPIALAPGLGLSTFFAYYVVGTLHLSWQVALGAVFFSGVLFFIMTIGGIRQAIINSVPLNLKKAIGVGIGLFIAFIGLKGMGIITPDEASYLTMGHLSNKEVLLSIFGLLLTAVLMAKNVKGSILIGILVITVLSMLLGLSPAPRGIEDILSFHLPSMAATFGEMDLVGAWHYGIFSIVFTFTVVELFDNMGTLIGVMTKANLVDKDGKIENLDKALTTDAVGTMVSACFGTSTVTSYIESAAGIAEGGRTGLTAVVVAFLFFISLFFAPLVGLVPAFATAPALVLVGALMLTGISEVNFSDFSEGLPAFLTIIMMPFTSSIANGFAFGFISYVFMKTLTGKVKEVSLVMWPISIAFLLNLALRT